MAQEIVRITKSQIENQLIENGLSKRDFGTIAFDPFNGAPLSGRFGGLDFRTYDGNKYAVFIILDEEYNKIGVIPVNRLFDKYLTVKEGIAETMQIGKGYNLRDEYVKSVPSAKADNFGKYCLVQKNINELSGFGLSKAEQISRLIGKTFSIQVEYYYVPNYSRPMYIIGEKKLVERNFSHERRYKFAIS